MTSRFLPRIDQPGDGGGGPPPTVEDHFAPKIIVGNTLNGDPAAAQSFPFRYIPDPGDGSGIALALTEAAVAGQGGDIYIRPGIYDFGLAGSPGLPLTVPDGVGLRGPSIGLPTAFGGTPSRGTLLRSSPSTRSMFILGSTSYLRQISFEITAPDPGAMGTFFIDAAAPGAPNFIDQVGFFLTAVSGDAVNESLTRIVRGEFLTLTNVILVTLGPYRPSSFALPDLVAFEGENMQADKVQAQGVDVGFLLNSTSGLDNCQASDVRNGIDIGVGAAVVRLGEILVIAEERGIIAAGPGSTISNCELLGSSAAGSIGIEVTGSQCQISNVFTSGFERPYVDSGPDNGLSNAQLSGISAPGLAGATLSGFQPRLSNVSVDGADIGVDVLSGASIAALSNVQVSVTAIGFAFRDGVVEGQLSNCRSNHATTPGVGTGLLVEDNASRVTAMGLHCVSHAVGVDYGGDNFTMIGANLLGNTTPIVVTGTPVDPEIAHVQM